MTSLKTKYIPINCAFHDYLEHFASLRKLVTVVYKDEVTESLVRIDNAIIFDLTGGRDGEYTHLKHNGQEEIVRNDYLVSVDDIRLSDFDVNSCNNSVI